MMTEKYAKFPNHFLIPGDQWQLPVGRDEHTYDSFDTLFSMSQNRKESSTRPTKPYQKRFDPKGFRNTFWRLLCHSLSFLKPSARKQDFDLALGQSLLSALLFISASRGTSCGDIRTENVTFPGFLCKIFFHTFSHFITQMKL